jgi:outer membrane autotransporter protein
VIRAIGFVTLTVGFLTMATEGMAHETFIQGASSSMNTACGASNNPPSVPCNGNNTVVGPGTIATPTAAASIEGGRRTGGESGDKTPKAGASGDTAAYSLGGGLGVFVSAGGASLNHHNNKFADGYSSAVPTVAVGADYRITDWMTAGLAVNYTYQDGSYDDGGNFRTHSYGPLLFANFTPLPGMFAQIALGYNREDYSQKRNASIFDNNTGAPVVDGSASGDYNGDMYSAGVLAGYDYPFQGFTIGPRAGLNYVYNDVEDYHENSGTGLALSYSGLNQRSLQTMLGALATIPISTGFGVVQPQIGVSWVHEFLNDSRRVQAEYRDSPDPAATKFTFQRERPARDWAVIDLGVSMVLPNQLQPFVSFSTIQGNDNFVSYGGQLGLRKAF